MELKSSKQASECADSRYSELDNWCSERLSAELGRHKQSGLKTVSGDASFRRYFRAHTASETSFIAVDAPPEHEDCVPFISIAKSWREQGIRTPAIHSVDVGRGYMLLEDFGDKLFYSSLEEYLVEKRSVERLYVSAMEALLALQKTVVPDDYPLPLYDEQRLRNEMQLFPEWFLKQLLKVEISEDEATLLSSLFTQITHSALEQPLVPVHRDYHSRNIMMLPDGLGLIDFQDAVLGPVTYDPVSLLRDCYIDWPQSQVYQWLDRFAERSPYLENVDNEQLHQWFDWMGAQRHIKVLGIFVRLWLRDGKNGYLKDLPRVYAYFRWVCERYSEFAETSLWLKEDIEPRLQKQSWWQDYKLKN
ncbi:phosphotransferase [Parendozoicomonas sp. Alg238-R29]|uniref:aminoglycoside phosphotransferase family protein n=1 Tax=Parendozoicomonas sp. Alg238-R29 TaxID=2993446 RepID=UPI00248DC0BC|nr:phosphotransferase [Parendozoicomonas sp. Alg238-R29]